MRRLLPVVVLAGVVTACSAASNPRPAVRTPPDLAAFLALPVATPVSCPPSVSGSTSGRRSPWVGHVDISVFVSDASSAVSVQALRASLASLPHVRRVYFESKKDAYAEYQRLYTCSGQVSPAQLPASYRLVLGPVSRTQRDDVVRGIARLPGVEGVSCDPSSPCTQITHRRPLRP